MPYNYHKTHSEEAIRLVEWINARDFFWLKEVMDEFGKRSNSNKSSFLTYALARLKKSVAIQCCEFKKSQRRYFVVRKVTVNDIYK